MTTQDWSRRGSLFPAALLSLFVGVPGGCRPQAAGMLGARCRADGTCDAGLTCLSGRCVTSTTDAALESGTSVLDSGGGGVDSGGTGTDSAAGCVCGDCVCGDGVCRLSCEDSASCAADCSTCPGPGLHDYFAPGASIGPEGLANGAVELVRWGDCFEASTMLCTGGLPITPGSSATSYMPVLSGDDSAVVVPLPFTFPFFGATWTSVYVGSNGFLTFGAPANLASATTADFYALPRAAPLDLDLAGGTVVVDENSTAFTVTWQGWSDVLAGTFVFDFQVTLSATGGVRFAWDAGPLGTTAFVGVSEGGGTVGTPVDFTCPGGYCGCP